MRKLAGSLCSLGLGVSAFCHAALSDTLPESNAAVVYRSSAASGESHFAIAIRALTKPAAVQRHIILTDTSASQTGIFRDQSIALVSGMLERIPATHQVAVSAVDSSVERLTSGFVKGQSDELRKSVAALSARTPMGATDLAEVVRACLVDAGSEPVSILYIGDGISAADQLSLADLEQLVDDLRSHSASFHAALLGPRVDSELPSLLANQTGGTVEDSGTLQTPAVFDRLAAAISTAPVLVTGLHVSQPGVTLSTDDVVALRSDRDTVVFGEGAPSNRLTVVATDASGASCSWTADPKMTHESGEVLHVLYDQSRHSEGLNNSVVGVAGLESATQRFTAAVNQSVTAARTLYDKGLNQKALEAARHGLALDSGNVVLTSLVSTLQEEQPPMPSGEDELGPPTADEGDALRRAEARNEIVTQQLVQSMNAAIAEARRVAPDQPEYALTLLKDLLDTIRASSEVAPEKRDELERRINEAYLAIQVQRDSIVIQQRQEAVEEAIRRDEEAILEATELEEERLQTLISQVRGLLQRAREGDVYAFEEAESVARTALELKPGNGTATAALVMAESSGQLSKAYRLINLRHDRFLETLYQVELSHVPFPDEPPIQYPPADVWRALTLARKKKYQSVALRSEKPVEIWLEEKLDEPIPDLTYPGDNSLSDILQFIADYYTDLGPHTMRILPDVSDQDIESIDYLNTVNVTDVDLKGITLRNALKLIFSQVKDQELTFIIKNEVMLITTVATAESEENLVTRIYDVADLVVPTIAQQGGGGQGGFGGGQQGGGFGGQGGGFGGQGGFGGGGQGGFGGGGAFSLPTENLAAPADGLNLKGSGVKKKP